MDWYEEGAVYSEGRYQVPEKSLAETEKRDRKEKTMAGQVLLHHHRGDEKSETLALYFDALASPDNNYVSILSTLEAVGVKKIDIPWVLSNCHNSLCTVSGTQSGDDHKFGEEAAKKYGAIYLPPYQGIIHQYMREKMAAPLKMILGSDSHTRYGPLGTLGFGEGGGEIAKHILGHSYPLRFPKIVLVELTGTLRRGVGPMDVALSILRETYEGNRLKNAIVEFQGEGVSHLSMDMRIGIDVMTTESGAISSIWSVDEKVSAYLRLHGREESFRVISPLEGAYYDHRLTVNLDEIEPMMAFPPHPAHAYPISFVMDHGEELFRELDEKKVIPGFSFRKKLKKGKVTIDQGIITGCAGGSAENIAEVSDILQGEIHPGEMRMVVSTASTPITSALMEDGTAGALLGKSIPLSMSICGGCFGVADIPAHGELSARHVTRNFPMREGAKRDKGQASAVILMDARSIAATYRNGGVLSSAMEMAYQKRERKDRYDENIYKGTVKDYFGKGDEKKIITLGPGISAWPDFQQMKSHLLLKVALCHPGNITTDDLVPSGEISALRSHPVNLSKYTLMNLDGAYANRAEAYLAEMEREAFSLPVALSETSLGTVIVGEVIGDGSSREQAASSQRILGGRANIGRSFATQRYIRNLLNYGMVPLLSDEPERFREGELLFFENLYEDLQNGKERLTAKSLTDGRFHTFSLPSLTEKERELILVGGLINYEKRKSAEI